MFAFNNYKLIYGLRERGQLIAKQDFDAMRKKELEIQELFDSADEFRELTIPTAAFVTFEEEDAKLLAMHTSIADKELLGQKLTFKEPSEPTDIIWENRHWTKNETFWRELKAASIAIFLVCLSGLFIYWVSTLSSTAARVFPTIDCQSLVDNYGSELDEFAVDDYDFIRSHPGMRSSGCLQCFC